MGNEASGSQRTQFKGLAFACFSLLIGLAPAAHVHAFTLNVQGCDKSNVCITLPGQRGAKVDDHIRSLGMVAGGLPDRNGKNCSDPCSQAPTELSGCRRGRLWSAAW